uniref:Phosphatidylinositol-specific phospholipase C X domain-containing protein n=1 Tax=Zooxanthella nutricula TaxID=1333877 RepID=A0A6U6VA71_9DINO
MAHASWAWRIPLFGCLALGTRPVAASGDEGACSLPEDAEASGLLQKQMSLSHLGSDAPPTSLGQTASTAVYRRPRLVPVKVGANSTCAESCAIMGGVPAESGGTQEAPQGAGSSPGGCTCDLGPGVVPAVRGAAPSSGALFRESPFLMTHDAATYSADYTAKTQYVDLVSQLRCGVRAFDLRTVAWYDDYRRLKYQHVTVDERVGTCKAIGFVSDDDQRVQDTVPAMIEWCNKNPTELVVLVVSHCYTRDRWACWRSRSCSEGELPGVFSDLGVKTMTDCDKLNSWTLEEAKSFARLPGGGMLLMIPGEGYCVEGNWDPDVTLAGGVDGVRSYVEKTMAASHEAPFQVQAFFQQKFITPELSADLNKNVYEWVTTPSDAPLLKGVNFLEVNLACAYGTSISSALGATISDEDGNQCQQACQDACKRSGACTQ